MEQAPTSDIDRRWSSAIGSLHSSLALECAAPPVSANRLLNTRAIAASVCSGRKPRPEADHTVPELARTPRSRTPEQVVAGRTVTAAARNALWCPKSKCQIDLRSESGLGWTPRLRQPVKTPLYRSLRIYCTATRWDCKMGIQCSRRTAVDCGLVDASGDPQIFARSQLRGL